MSIWITLSVIALIPVFLRAPKALTPLRVSAADPSRFTNLFWRYASHAFTGYASDVDKRGDSYTKGSFRQTTGSTTVHTTNSYATDTTINVNHPTGVEGSIDTNVVITDRFFLTDVQGQSRSFEGTGFEAQVGNGHLVSLAWLSHGRGKSGRYFLIFNHATGEPFFDGDAIWDTLIFPYPKAYLTILIIMILPIPILVLFWLVGSWQQMKFQRVGVKPFIASLESKAAGLPIRAESATQVEPSTSVTTDLASSLQEITALRDSGALSQAEFEAAKAKLLAP